VPPSETAQELQSTIDTFVAAVPGVLAAALGTSDGLLVTGSGALERGYGDELAAVACGLVSIVSGSTIRIWDDDRVQFAVARLSQRILMVKPVVDGSILAVVTASTADVDAIGAEVGVLVQKIGQQLTPALREELQQALPL
jgi:predicted regulator of Ras-like GTPase activity (Roadblock/LC7/MglB family)